MDQDTAKQAVLKYLNAKYPVPGDELVILDERTRATPYGWVFFFNSRRFVETRDVLLALGGNGPIVFERDTAAIVELPSHSPPDEVIRHYEATRARRDG
jgi:hypothetical protein